MDTNNPLLRQTMAAFPGSFINSYSELVLIPLTNTFLDLKMCQTDDDLKVKLLSAVSRECCKTTPYAANSRNKKFHQETLAKLNKALETDFSIDEIKIIYNFIGGGCNRSLAYKFVESRYDLSVFK